FDQDVLPHAVQLRGKDADPRDIAIRPGKRFYQSLPDHIACDPNDGNAHGCLLYGGNCLVSSSIDDIGLGYDQLRRMLRNQIDMRCKGAVINREVLVFNETSAPEFVEKTYVKGYVARMRRQATQAINPPRFLGQRCEWQRRHRTASKRHEIAPSHWNPNGKRLVHVEV